MGLCLAANYEKAAGPCRLWDKGSPWERQTTHEVLVESTGVFVRMPASDDERASADETYFRQAPTSALEIWLGYRDR